MTPLSSLNFGIVYFICILIWGFLQYNSYDIVICIIFIKLPFYEQLNLVSEYFYGFINRLNNSDLLIFQRSIFK